MSIRNPTITEVLNNPATSWIKFALRSALERDPIDAEKDAQFLLRLLSARADAQRWVTVMKGMTP